MADHEQQAVVHAERDLTRHEQELVRERAGLRTIVVYETVRREGEQELRRPALALAFSGLAAGLSMGFSMLAEGLLANGLPETEWRPLVSRLGYSVGFLVVVLGRQQLFTENTLTVILPLLVRRNLQVVGRVLRLWGIVLATNLLGALLFAYTAASTRVFTDGARLAFAEIGLDAMTGDFWTTFLRAVFAGWLIALMVWLLPAAEASRVAIIVVITYLIGIAGFSHVIAGSVEAMYAVVSGNAEWSRYFGSFLVPTLLGNVVGGVTLVAILSHVQVAPESASRSIA